MTAELFVYGDGNLRGLVIDNRIFNYFVCFFRSNGRLGFWCEGQKDGEGRAFVGFAFHIDSAAVEHYDFVYDGKTETCSLDFLSGSLDAIELLEYF